MKDKLPKVSNDRSSNFSESVQPQKLIPKKEVVGGDPCDTAFSHLCKEAYETKDLINGRELVVLSEKNAADLSNGRDSCSYPMGPSNKQVLKTSRDELRKFSKSPPGVKAPIPRQKHSAGRMHIAERSKLNPKYIGEIRFKQAMGLPIRTDSNILRALS